MSVDPILKQIAALSAAERNELKSRMAERFPDAPCGSHLSPELATLLHDRVAAADASPQANVPWDVVYAESLKRARK
jgi:hypothetical protein